MNTENERRYDVKYGDKFCTIDEHFCREYGCYGTNPLHGYTWEEAKAMVIEYYKDRLARWENMNEDEYAELGDY